jgi:hypothetical protein
MHQVQNFPAYVVDAVLFFTPFKIPFFNDFSCKTMVNDGVGGKKGGLIS